MTFKHHQDIVAYVVAAFVKSDKEELVRLVTTMAAELLTLLSSTQESLDKIVDKLDNIKLELGEMTQAKREK